LSGLDYCRHRPESPLLTSAAAVSALAIGCHWIKLTFLEPPLPGTYLASGKKQTGRTSKAIISRHCCDKSLPKGATFSDPVASLSTCAYSCHPRTYGYLLVTRCSARIARKPEARGPGTRFTRALFITDPAKNAAIFSRPIAWCWWPKFSPSTDRAFYPKDSEPRAPYAKKRP